MKLKSIDLVFNLENEDGENHVIHRILGFLGPQGIAHEVIHEQGIMLPFPEEQVEAELLANKIRLDKLVETAKDLFL